ncbi:EF-hand domain-containing protein [Profundibacter amoris]|uniref:EF-hand domain-containing protein n=1 Tax=Profundibacter amoris TaxID=2171755 RepID=UPI0013C36D92|nr:EF-hand domain-containing protein [Profundibacter amoris]
MKITAAVFLSISPLQAQTDTAASGENIISLPNSILQQIRRNPEQFVRNTINTLFRVSTNGIVTKETLETYHMSQIARSRSSSLQNAFIYDLDGNMQIDAVEITSLGAVLSTRDNAKLQTLLATADTNQDGTLSLEEIRANASRQANQTRLDVLIGALMAFDVNQDGRVTPGEIGLAIANLDKPGTTPAPQKPSMHNDTIEKPLPESSLCKYPAPTSGAEIVFISGYEGAAVSTVAVSGVDRETSVAVLNIEKGDTPLYIVTTAYDSIIWKIEGDVGRVEQIVAGYGHYGAGVTGLPKEKVHFLPNAACISKYFTKPDSGKALIAKANLSQRLGRDIDVLVTNYELTTVSVPSGGIRKTRNPTNRGTVIIHDGKRYVITTDGPKLLDDPASQAGGALEKNLLHSLYRFYPAGIMELDAKDVIASSKAENYEVLPQQAGLLQLARQGALKPTSDGYLMVVKPIKRFPPGLNGAHSVKFILGKGIKMPAGDPGHSEVILEENGKCVAGYSCR